MGINRKVKRNQEKASNVNISDTLETTELRENVSKLKKAVSDAVFVLKTNYDNVNSYNDGADTSLLSKLEGSYQLLVEYNDNTLTPLLRDYNELVKDEPVTLSLLEPTVIEFISKLQDAIYSYETLYDGINATTMVPYKEFVNKVKLNMQNNEVRG